MISEKAKETVKKRYLYYNDYKEEAIFMIQNEVCPHCGKTNIKQKWFRPVYYCVDCKLERHRPFDCEDDYISY